MLRRMRQAQRLLSVMITEFAGSRAAGQEATMTSQRDVK